MTMAESAVEDAAAAPPGPAKPPPPACTNNNTLAATANRNHRPSRKRRRLNQVLDDLQAHKIIPSEGEVPTRLDSTSLASEEEEDVFGSPRSTSRSASENALQPLTKRLKTESLRTPTEDETPSPSHMPYHHYPHYLYHHDHNSRRHHPAHSLQYQSNNNNNNNIINNNSSSNNNNGSNHYHSQNTTSSFQHQNSHQTNSVNQNHHPSTYHRPPQKFRGCGCINCANPPVSAAAVAAAAAAMLLPSPTSPLTPLTPLTAFTPMSLTPLTPVSPSSYSFEHYLNTKYLPAVDVIKKRSYSDSDVPGWDHRPPSSVSSIVTSHTPRSGSLESDATSPQESPLDLSMKNLGRALIGVNRPSALQLLPPDVVTRGSVSVPVVRGDVASPTTKESVASRYNLAVSPVVEAMPAGADVAYVCPVCGQMFSLHDRLAKHMASRHRRQGPRDASAKAYRCDVCKRSFARSDMLTRHMRLHTGVKPYTCKVCKQVFSRSDHLSTHQRTHTGEKPYKCPQCVYAACRRDMITRHLRTHAKMGDGQVAKCEDVGAGPESPTYVMEPMTSVVKME